MDKDFCITLNGHELEYLADCHCYLVDGVLVPSITRLVRKKVGERYTDADPEVIRRAAEAGTRVHEAIENLVMDGVEEDLPEVHNFQFLMDHHDLYPLSSEVPVILFWHGDPIAAGRLDLVLENSSYVVGLADIKRTSSLDKEYLFWQLNLYRFAYEQSYGGAIEFLRGIHLREDVRKLVAIPMNTELITEYLEEVWKEQYDPETIESNPREMP